MKLRCAHHLININMTYYVAQIANKWCDGWLLFVAFSVMLGQALLMASHAVSSVLAQLALLLSICRVEM